MKTEVVHQAGCGCRCQICRPCLVVSLLTLEVRVEDDVGRALRPAVLSSQGPCDARRCKGADPDDELLGLAVLQAQDQWR